MRDLQRRAKRMQDQLQDPARWTVRLDNCWTKRLRFHSELKTLLSHPQLRLRGVTLRLPEASGTNSGECSDLASSLISLTF